VCRRPDGQRAFVAGQSRLVGKCGSDNILLEQVERHSQKNQVLHQKSNGFGHCRETAGRSIEARTIW
jgi:hypothetical protein